MSPSLARLAAGFAALSLSSCVMPPTEYGGGYSNPGYYNSGYYAPAYGYDDFYYYGGGPYPSYYNRGYGGYTAGYSYYRGSSQCPICHHSPCSGHKGHSSSWKHSSGSNSSRSYATHQDQDNHPSSGRGNSNQSVNRTQYERAPGTPGKADGTHSKEWFLSRGYSARQIEKADGDSGRSTGRNNRYDDDDKKKSHDSDGNKKSNDNDDNKKKR